MKVELELQNGERRTYENAERVDQGKYQITIYGQNGVLAIVSTGDIKTLLTDQE